MNAYALTFTGIVNGILGRDLGRIPSMPSDKAAERVDALNAFFDKHGSWWTNRYSFPELTYEGDEVYEGGLWLASLSRGGKGWDVDGEGSTAEAALDAMLNALSSQLEHEGRYEPTVEREAR